MPDSNPPEGAAPPPRTTTAPFFIVGAERSGTTMLRLMLNAHPEVVVPSETWFLIDLMNALPLTGPLDTTHQERACQVIVSHRRWKDMGIPDAVLVDRVMRLTRPALADVMSAIYAELLERAQKSRWGDKTPEYVIEIDRLHRVFPESKFLHVIRDARDVSLSLMKKQWRGTFTVNAARYWSNYVTRGMISGRRLPAGLYREVHYEDIVRDPERSLREICEFLELRYTDDVLHFHRGATEKIPAYERSHHTNTARAPQMDDIHRWKREGSWMQVMSVEAVAGSTMDRVRQERHFRGVSRLLPAVLGLAESALWGALRLRRTLFGTPPARAQRD
jgi:hypothetical protein